MLRVKNFIPAISLEGDEASTDSRRGKGTYQKVRRAMELLHQKKLPYGISSCYTSVNYDSITSEEYYDSLIEMGAYFIWYFHYMPVGNDAAPELLPNPEQREAVYHRIRHLRATKPLFAMDFQNDAEYVGGCIAGGKRYLHINANGDVDPCVFIHYSNANIRECTLLEALQSPIFMAYHDNMPFNDNMLRPCPMLENPERLRKMVADCGAHSTDPMSPETVEHLCSKCDQYAAHWAPEAEKLWEKSQANYVADAATQTAKRIDDLLVGAENSINAIARMYERSLDPSQANVEVLEQLTESTVFDYIGYVNADGILTDSSGRQADAADRHYVQDGLNGNSGLDMIFNGRISGENLVIFYAPLRQNKKVVGVLTGRYRQQQMRDIITSSYFGEPANTYE